MSTFVAHPEPSFVPAAESQAVMVRRSAFYLDSLGQPLFAWLHHCDERLCFDHGVIICLPIGCEQLHAHRSLRHLADAIAREGLPVMRLDYHGTGDSAGTDEDPQRVATWLANVRAAVSWMRGQGGCRQVSLIGLRVGAALATLAANDEEIDNLVLWAPVVKGRTYVREMKALSLTADAAFRMSDDPSNAIEAAGFVVSKETADEISRIDLVQSTPRCRRVLIVTRDDVAPDTRLFDHLSTLGIYTEQIAQPCYIGMMAEPHATQVPYHSIGYITDWLVANVTDECKPNAALNFAATQPTTAIVTDSDDMKSTADRRQSLRERICNISDQPNLFGVLTESEHKASERLPLVVLLNAGCAYRIGPGRLHVLLARQLAAAGFRTLRMDLCGLGDSVLPDSQNENDSYAATAFRDIDLTLTYVQRHCGAQRVVLMGLCSGAYAAFQSAAQLTNPVLVESVLVNPLTFFWKEGMTLGTSTTNQLISWHYYLTAFLKPNKWRGLLFGKSRLGVRGAITRLARRPQLPKCSKHVLTLANADIQAGTGFSHPQRDDLPGDLDRVLAAGRKLALVCSANDPGHFILMFRARRKAKRLRRAGCLNVFFVKGADHTFSSRRSRQELAQIILEDLRNRYESADMTSRATTSCASA